MSDINEDCHQPGFRKMGLNLMFIVDPMQIENKRLLLNNAKHLEHATVHLAIDLMTSIIDSNTPLSKNKNDAMEFLERNLLKRPKHLNSLADLAVLYSANNLSEKAKNLEIEISSILKNSSNECMKEKAICLLEQGYALLFEEGTKIRPNIDLNLQEAYKFLKIEETKSASKTSPVSRAKQHILNARKELLLITKSNESDDNLLPYHKKKRGFEYLSKGIALLKELSLTNEDHEEVVIWKYYLGMLCGRICECLQNENVKHRADNMEMTELTVQSIDLFCTVIRDLPEENNIYRVYRARSYAYIGHTLLSRKEILKDEIKSEWQCLGKEFSIILNDPEAALDKAMQLLPEDDVILIRCGFGLHLLSKCEKDEQTKLRKLRRLEKMFSNIAVQNPEIHLVLSSLIVNVYNDMSLLSCVPNTERKKMLLDAKENCVEVVRANHISHDICTLADICQRLAKFPTTYLYGPENVNERSYLIEAFNHLCDGIRVNGQNFYLAFRTSHILFDLGELRRAIVFAKRAYFFSDPSQPFLAMKNVLSHVLAQKESTVLYEELLEVLTEFEKFTGNMEIIKEAVLKACKPHIDKIWPFMKFLSVVDLTEIQVQIAELLRDMLLAKKSRHHLEKQLRSYMYVTAKEVQLESILYQREISSDTTFATKYDFCIICSKIDINWIKWFVVHELEQQILDNDDCLKGWSGNLNYESSTSFVTTCVNAMNECMKIILVLSDSFLKSEWPLLKPYVLPYIDKSINSFCLVVLTDIKQPTELKQLPSVVLIERKKIPLEIQKLKILLL